MNKPNELTLDLDQGFWSTTDSFKTKIHVSTNYLQDEYIRVITDYKNREQDEKNYIDELLTQNPDENYIVISVNPTTKTIDFSFSTFGDYINAFLKDEHQYQLINELSEKLNQIDSIDNSRTTEYKQQIGSNFDKYKEAVDSFVVNTKLFEKDINNTFQFFQETNNGAYQFTADLSDETVKVLKLPLLSENGNKLKYEILGAYETIPEKFTKNNEPYLRFDNRNLIVNAIEYTEDDDVINADEIDYQVASPYIWKNIDSFFDEKVAESMEQTEQYNLFKENPIKYAEEIVLSLKAPSLELENKPIFIENVIENNKTFERYELSIQNDTELLKQMTLNSGAFNHTFIFDISHHIVQNAYTRRELLDGTVAVENFDLDMIPPKLQDKLQDWYKKESQGKELWINEGTYIELADKICQAAYESSASGFNTEMDFEDIAHLADRDIDWVKLHIEKIGETLVTYHNDELLLDFNPFENINKENQTIEFNFCSVGEDANELFKFEDGRWKRKSNRELEADGYIISVDIKYSFTYKPNQDVAEEKQLLVDSICDLFIEGTESVDQKTKSLPGGKFNIEFILRHDFSIEPGSDYFNLNFDNINDRILYEMNNIIKNNEKLHCFTIDSIESFIPEEFHVRKNLVLINNETIENFSKTPEEYLKELNPEMVSFAGSSMWREEERFTSDKNNFLEIMERYPAIKNYVEKKWDLLKEKSLQHDKEVEFLWNKGILLFKDTKYWEDILTEIPADSKENESFILSKLHSKIRQEIVDSNSNENINWENESWNYICETMQRKSLDYDYSVNYNNGLTSKDLQDFIACDFITIKMNLQDKEMESLWEKLEDIPFVEDEEGRLILDSDEPWHNFEPGTEREEIWRYFDKKHSKGISYLLYEYENDASKTVIVDNQEQLLNKNSISNDYSQNDFEKNRKINENFSISTYFRTQLLEEMKTSSTPFIAAHKVVQELNKSNPKRVKELNKYLKDNGCVNKQGFEKFFCDVIGLTKNKTKKKQKNNKEVFYER